MFENKRKMQLAQSLVLDTAVASAVLYVCCFRNELLNPWGLEWEHWCLVTVSLRFLIVLYDHLVEWVMETFQPKLLPTRTTDKPVRYVGLDALSVVYLTINAMHESVLTQRFSYYVWHSPDISKDLSDIGVLNTVGALYAIFVINDLLYAPMHHFLHLPSIYPLVHKHHHRQHFPTRGYLDAGNEHPLEHFLGIMCLWAAVITAVATTGAHTVTLFLYFNVNATLQMLNHSPFDVAFSFLGIKFSVRNHEMHHRKFNVNYGQYCMWYDQAMQTYGPYEGPQKVVESNSSGGSGDVGDNSKKAQ
mmetsp:Transcript_1496/g.3703  ORF Transcript_1496/g.3703 Transcript_1496/m.3703 type:complete len:303 (-) Transcript_1496:143-1051(-)